MNLFATLSRLVAVTLIGIPTCIWDLRHQRIPDTLTISAFLAGGILWIVTSPSAWWEMGLAVSAGVLIPLAARVATAGGLGWGDIKLSAGLALFTGWPGILLALGAAATLALAGVVAESMAAGHASRNEAGVPFGPFLICGAVIAIVGLDLQAGPFPGEIFR